MRIAIVLLVLAGACTKKNPEACCTDAPDCQSVGLPNVTTCDDGLLCRGNRCVEELCSIAGDCDATAPYCVTTDEGRCAEDCTKDSQCPGFSQGANDKFCVGGSCVECRAGMDDCTGETPVCSSEGRCVACVTHADCATGVCANGTCAAENQIAFVTTNGSPSSECTKTSPCSNISRALLVSPPRQYILVESGTYSSATTVELNGVRWIIGRGPSRPVLTRSTDGAVVNAIGGVNVKLERLEVFGGRGVNPNDGHAIRCSGNASRIELVDVALRMNAGDGFSGSNCTLKARQTMFENNTGHAVSLIDANGDLDRCTAVGNGFGLQLDSGVFSVTNSVIARNGSYGIDLYSIGSGNLVAFNTIIDNGASGSIVLGGLSCNLQGSGTGTFENNIIARNLPMQTAGTGCASSNSLAFDSDITALKLVRPDSAPYDYHLQSGSVAVDLAGTSSIKVDIDGESRPSGVANDIGADELQQ